MKLSSQALYELKKLYFIRYGINLSDDEANGKGLELLTFISCIAKPIPIEDKELLEQIHGEYVQDQKIR